MSTQDTPLGAAPIEGAPLENMPNPAPVPAAIPEPNAIPMPTVSRGPLPDSPLDRARLESQGKLPKHKEAEDRSTMVALGLLFVVPILIILFSVLLLLPFINAQLTQDPDPGGATVQTSPNLQPSR